MSNYENMKLLIQEISGTGERTLAVSKSFLEFTGSLEEGVFLSQVIYYSDKSSRKDGYFWKSYDEWKEHTFMTEYTLRKQVKALKDKGYLETALKKAHGAPTLHYKFNMDKFVEDFVPFLRNRKIDSSNSQNGNFDIADSLTKSTTKITTNKNIINSSKTKVSKPKAIFEDDSFEMLLARFFIYEMKNNTPLFKEPSNIQNWCNDVRLAVDVDLKDISEDRNERFKVLKEIIIHSCRKPFYSKNIRSIAKLRKRIEEVYADLIDSNNKQNKLTYSNNTTNQTQTVNQYNPVDTNSLFEGGEW